jgi:hypothetical protein
LICNSVTVAVQYTVKAKTSKKVEGRDLKKSESGVMRFVRCERGGGEWFTYSRDACL